MPTDFHRLVDAHARHNKDDSPQRKVVLSVKLILQQYLMHGLMPKKTRFFNTYMLLIFEAISDAFTYRNFVIAYTYEPSTLKRSFSFED